MHFDAKYKEAKAVNRLSLRDHREDNARLSGLQLNWQDLEQIENILVRSNVLYRLIGDCGDEYRLK